MLNRLIRRRPALLAGAAVVLAAAAPTVLGFMGGPPNQTQVPTTPADFFLPGTQPNNNPYEFTRVVASNNCGFCHGDYNPDFAPVDSWVTSMMGQSARDPVWHAALAIANQDVQGVGHFCIRCHAPGAWLGERGQDGTTADFIPDDFDGINCHFCHRMVDPELGPDSAVGYDAKGQDPHPDVAVLNALAKQGLVPQGAGNARYVVDPADVRRGPFSDVPINYHGTDQFGTPIWLITSPFHTKSEFCGTCHDVSNPVFTKNQAGQYEIGPLGAPHPTQNPHDMFPEQRTYSEWKNSQFATTGVEFPDGRFGGALTGPMRSCQDCHMPDQVGGGCAFWQWEPFFERPNMPQHSMAGANTWVIEAVAYELGWDADYIGLTKERVQAAKARVVQMLRDASDMELAQVGAQIRVRVVNQTGHKLPTGYPEGRRMWVNVKFYDQNNALVAEHGAYDHATAVLSTGDTKVYEAKHGTDAAVEAATGVPAGVNFHLALANVKYKDNRIPPRGFTNAAFEADGCAPVAYTYADGQYWDDSYFPIPAGATSAVATLYYQTTTKEYAEFLRDANTTNSAGLNVYALWEKFGKSPPVDMDSAALALVPAVVGDLNGDGVVNGADLGILLSNWNQPGATDLNGDGTTNGADLGMLLANWG
jgi:hypothetical protein